MKRVFHKIFEILVILLSFLHNFVVTRNCEESKNKNNIVDVKKRGDENDI